jgi:hypothetical protein
MEFTGAEYRQFAQQCRELASSAKTIEEQIFLRERAAAWIQLARKLKQREANLDRRNAS